MLEELQSVLTGSEGVHECRRCGTSVSARTRRCPACETDSIARYTVQ